MIRDYECPKCGEWVAVNLDSENDGYIYCGDCKTHLQLDTDSEFVNGSWKDLSKLIPV